MNNLERLSKRVKEKKAYKEVFDDLERARLRLKKFKELQKWKKGSFARRQIALNTLTKRKCKVCKGFMTAKKQKFCSNHCSYVANYKYKKNQ